MVIVLVGWLLVCVLLVLRVRPVSGCLRRLRLGRLRRLSVRSVNRLVSSLVRLHPGVRRLRPVCLRSETGSMRRIRSV